MRFILFCNEVILICVGFVKKKKSETRELVKFLEIKPYQISVNALKANCKLLTLITLKLNIALFQNKE